MPFQCLTFVAAGAFSAATITPKASSSAPVISGPTFDKSLSTPDPVPEVGRLRALELMKSGALFRYTPGVLSETSLAEEAICKYTGFKYAIGLNSCGSALFLALKCVGVQPNDLVLANAFSFTAVPSAIHHAFATPIYVESTDAFVMDLDDLAIKITPETRYLMLTHMRGRVANIDRVYELAELHDLVVIEDCAHALGIRWDNVQVGRKARVACFSTQSAKMINSGEGGFLCTDDPEIAARAICYAGCYELLYQQHTVAPPAEYFERIKFETPNYSLRMSDLTACCIRPQLATIDERAKVYNARYARMCEALSGCEHIHIPPILDRVSAISDSLQFNLRGMTKEHVAAFLTHSKLRGMPVGLFGSKDNARNFRNWAYSPIATSVGRTEEMIGAAIDVRLPLTFDDADFDTMAAVILASVEDAMAEKAGRFAPARSLESATG